jgi:hypothetical protein
MAMATTMGTRATSRKYQTVAHFLLAILGTYFCSQALYPYSTKTLLPTVVTARSSSFNLFTALRRHSADPLLMPHPGQVARPGGVRTYI